MVIHGMHLWRALEKLGCKAPPYCREIVLRIGMDDVVSVTYECLAEGALTNPGVLAQIIGGAEPMPPEGLAK